MNPDYSFAGLADLYIGPYGGNTLKQPVGNVSKCDVTPSVKQLKEQNYGRTGGLKRTKDRILGVAVAMVFRNFSIAHLAMLLRGGVTTVAAGTVASGSAESYVANLGGLIELAFISPSSVVVKNQDGTTTYVDGKDYQVTGAGVIPLASGAIAEGDTIKINYGYSAQSVLQAFAASDQEFAITFDGLNEMDNNNNCVGRFFRMKLNTVKTLSLIGDDLATLEVNADLLIDSTKTGTGLSQYFTWTYGSANA